MTSHPLINATDWANQLLRLTGSAERISAPALESAPIADWARSGAVMITGTPNQPLMPNGFAATAARGALLAFDALTGKTSVGGEQLLGERAALSGWPAKAPWTLGLHSRAVRTRDGWFALSLARPVDLETVPALIGAATTHEWISVDAWARTQSTGDAVNRCRLLGMPAAEIGSVRAHELMTVKSAGITRSRELTGVRVVDLSTLWAGPLCGNLLQSAGTEVLRVESSQRPDGSREGVVAFDNLLHAGQSSVTFDPHALDFLHALVDLADIVITSARPRGLASLGLDPQRWLADRADGVWIQISAYGSTREEANWIGFGDDTAMAAGLVRWIDGIPIPVADALADPLTGVHAAVAAAALVQRGGTHLVDIALANVAAATFADAPSVDPTFDGGQWVIETEFGIRPIEKPKARTVLGTARALGADNDRVRAELAR
jgi:hypothetical protein